MLEDPDLDVTELTRQFAGQQSHPYGKTYHIADIPDDLVRTYTYNSTNPYFQSNLTFRLRDNTDRQTEQIKTTNTNKSRGPAVTTSPYDFHGLVEPAVEWTLVNQFEGPVLNDAQYTGKIFEEDICYKGKAKVFDTKILSTRPNKRRPLPAATATEEPSIITDPVIVDIVKEPTTHQMRVLTTAKCLASISVCNRSVCPFELVFDKRDKDLYVYPRTANSPAVSESTYESITVSTNNRREDASSDFLGTLQESCNIQAQFAALATSGETQEFELGDEITFPDEEPSTPGCYVYRRFVIGTVEYIVRCQIDCLRDPVQEGERPQTAICRTFNDLPTELERRVNWAVDLEKQRSSLLLAEVKDNCNTFARWTAIGRLMDCAQIFLAFAERKTKANTQVHQILAAERQSYIRASTIISLSEKSMMGLINLIFAKVAGQEDGIYHFQRDARKRSVKIYKE